MWSVTSFTELRRDGMAAERARRLGGSAESWVETCLKGSSCVVAASDYVSAVADLIRPYVPGRYVALGTDGFGRSEGRASLRDFFEVDAKHIVLATLDDLARDGKIEVKVVQQAVKDLGINPEKPNPAIT